MTYHHPRRPRRRRRLVDIGGLVFLFILVTMQTGEQPVFEDYCDVLRTKATVLKEMVQSKERTLGISCVPIQGDFAWNKQGVHVFDTNMKSCGHLLVHAVQNHCFASECEWWPWKGMPMFVRFLAGACVVLMLSPEQVKAAASDVPGWLTNKQCGV